MIKEGFNKTDSIIENEITRHFLHYTVNVFQNHLLFHATQITTPILNSILSANHDKGLGF